MMLANIDFLCSRYSFYDNSRSSWPCNYHWITTTLLIQFHDDIRLRNQPCLRRQREYATCLSHDKQWVNTIGYRQTRAQVHCTRGLKEWFSDFYSLPFP